MPPHPIQITAFDRIRLKRVLQLIRSRYRRGSHEIDALEQKLASAVTVDATAIPQDVVTMNSRVQLTDLDSGARFELTLVFPGAADESGRVSVLAPIGRALLGLREAQVLLWPGAARLKRLLLDKVIYQPEAAGHLAV